MLTRRLTLKKETLTALVPEDMAGIGGAAGPESAGTCFSCVQCLIEKIGFASMDLTNCCQGIPTFHRAGGAAC